MRRDIIQICYFQIGPMILTGDIRMPKNDDHIHYWQPTFRYTWSLKQLQAWVKEFGSRAFRDGELWAIKNKRVCPGYYEVWFEPYIK